jgi:hypothetical protein
MTSTKLYELMSSRQCTNVGTDNMVWLLLPLLVVQDDVPIGISGQQFTIE